MGKKRAKIKIDYSKCQQPENCAKCLQVCQPAVFSLVFTDKDYHDPKDWKVVPVFPMLCICDNDSKSCVENCPKQAINVKLKK